MFSPVFLIEIGLVFGIVLGLAGWELWRTNRSIEADRTDDTDQ